MKRYLLSLLVSVGLVVSLCSCGGNTDEGIYFSLSDTPSTSFYMKTEYSEYDADVEQIKLIFGREDGKVFEFDFRYIVYVYEDNEWKKLAFDSSFSYQPGTRELVKKDPNAPDAAEASQIISVADLNVKLTSGRYKVQKEFEDGSVCAEFVIN